MFTSWNHLDYLVRLESQLAMCLGTFWVLLRRHPATLTFDLGLELCTASHRALGVSAHWRPLRSRQHVTLSGVGQKTLTTRFPSSLVPTSRLYTTGPHCRLAIRARHHRAKSPKSNRLYMEPEARTFMVPGQKMKKIKILIFLCFDSFQVIRGSNQVSWGHSRSLKVTQGQIIYKKYVKFDYFKWFICNLNFHVWTLNGLIWPWMTLVDLDRPLNKMTFHFATK